MTDKKNLDMSYKCLVDDREEMTRTLQLRAVERNKAEEAEMRALATAHDAIESLNRVIQQQEEMTKTIREQGECNDRLRVEWDNERNRWELVRRDLQGQLDRALDRNNKAKIANDERKRTINELQEQRREILKEMGQLAQNHRELREDYQESKEETQALQVQLQRAVQQRDALKRKEAERARSSSFGQSLVAGARSLLTAPFTSSPIKKDETMPPPSMTCITDD